jgi:hypothetical protein
MRLLQKITCFGVSGTLVLSLSAAVCLEAQSPSIQAPILGFMPDAAGSGIRPIFGVPGASSVGDRLQFEMDIRDAVISPNQDYAIAVRNDDAQAVVIDLGTGTAVTVPGVRSRTDVIAISPMGSAAALYDQESKTVQVIGRLPRTPQVINEFQASHIPGRGVRMAVSDDGGVALVEFIGDDGVALWAMDASGRSARISADHPADAAFLPNRRDAIVADDASRTVFLILDAAGTATPVPLMSATDDMEGFSSVAASDDGRQVFVADASSGIVATVDVETRRATVMSCGCRPTGLYRLKGNSIFRLTEISQEPVRVLDASSSEPRILIIPPSASAAAEAQ